MKKYLLFAGFVLLFVVSVSFAVGIPLGFAPNGKKAIAMTKVARTVDMRADGAWGFYGMSTCKFRVMSTTTKAGMLNTIPETNRVQFYVNEKTPYLNFTTCKSGELQRQ